MLIKLTHCVFNEISSIITKCSNRLQPAKKSLANRVSCHLAASISLYRQSLAIVARMAINRTDPT